MIQFSYLGDKLNTFYTKQPFLYKRLERLVLRFPSLQNDLTELTALIQAGMAGGAFSPELKNQLDSVMERLNLGLFYLKQELIDKPLASSDLPELEMEHLINDYVNSFSYYFTFIRRQILEPQKADLNFSQLNALSAPAFNLGSQLWSKALSDLRQLFVKDREYWLYELWTILGLTLALMAFAFYIGLAVTYNATKRLGQLTHATNLFANGQFSIRLPVRYQDEIGRQTQGL